MLRVLLLETLDESPVKTEETAHAKPRGNLEHTEPRVCSSF